MTEHYLWFPTDLYEEAKAYTLQHIQDTVTFYSWASVYGYSSAHSENLDFLLRLAAHLELDYGPDDLELWICIAAAFKGPWVGLDFRQANCRLGLSFHVYTDREHLERILAMLGDDQPPVRGESSEAWANKISAALNDSTSVLLGGDQSNFAWKPPTSKPQTSESAHASEDEVVEGWEEPDWFHAELMYYSMPVTPDPNHCISLSWRQPGEDGGRWAHASLDLESATAESLLSPGVEAYLRAIGLFDWLPNQVAGADGLQQLSTALKCFLNSGRHIRLSAVTGMPLAYLGSASPADLGVCVGAHPNANGDSLPCFEAGDMVYLHPDGQLRSFPTTESGSDNGIYEVVRTEGAHALTDGPKIDEPAVDVLTLSYPPECQVDGVELKAGDGIKRSGGLTVSAGDLHEAITAAGPAAPDLLKTRRGWWRKLPPEDYARAKWGDKMYYMHDDGFCILEDVALRRMPVQEDVIYYRPVRAAVPKGVDHKPLIAALDPRETVKPGDLWQPFSNVVTSEIAELVYQLVPDNARYYDLTAAYKLCQEVASRFRVLDAVYKLCQEAAELHQEAAARFLAASESSLCKLATAYALGELDGDFARYVELLNMLGLRQLSGPADLRAPKLNPYPFGYAPVQACIGEEVRDPWTIYRPLGLEIQPYPNSPQPCLEDPYVRETLKKQELGIEPFVA